MLSQAGKAVEFRLAAWCSCSKACRLSPLYMAARPNILQTVHSILVRPWGSCWAPVDMPGQNSPFSQKFPSEAPSNPHRYSQHQHSPVQALLPGATLVRW